MHICKSKVLKPDGLEPLFGDRDRDRVYRERDKDGDRVGKKQRDMYLDRQTDRQTGRETIERERERETGKKRDTEIRRDCKETEKLIENQKNSERKRQIVWALPRDTNSDHNSYHKKNQVVVPNMTFISPY